MRLRFLAGGFLSDVVEFRLESFGTLSLEDEDSLLRLGVELTFAESLREQI